MFGSQLKKLRNETGLSQAALARELSVSQQTVASWEVDRSSPSPEMLSLIADVFSVSTDYLLERTDQTVVVSNLRLKELRLQHRYTQKELAIKLNIAQNTLCNWENGNRTVDEPTLQKLADFFDVSVDYLLGRTDEKKPAAETGDEPKAEINERLHTIRIAGRDGSYEERQLTDEQMDLLRQMIRQMPKPQDGDL